MLWRSISAVIVLFWAVMTGLIIRDTYFPDNSEFAVVPPKLVFELFLTQGGSFNNQLVLLHDHEKLGHVNFTILRANAEEDEEKAGAKQPPVYGIMASGSIAAAGETAPGLATSFHLRAELENGDQWRSFELDTRTNAMSMTGHLKWQRGDEFPKIELRKGEELVLNSDILKTMMAISGNLSGASSAIGGGQLDWLSKVGAQGQGDQPVTVTLQAHEGLMELAGKSRPCYILSATAMGLYEAKFFFTELGQLARIELPNGYRLIEPMMHGLEPGLNVME